MEYDALPEPPGNVGSDEDVKMDSCMIFSGAAILVAGEQCTEAMQIHAALGSGYGITWISSDLSKLLDHSEGSLVNFLFEGRYSVNVADGHQCGENREGTGDACDYFVGTCSVQLGSDHNPLA